MTAANRHILIVEDDPDISEATCLVLRSMGYTVVTAVHGAEALEHLRGAPAPRLILLDLMMPVMDGWQFLKECEKDPRLAAIPVVVVTGAGRQALEKALLRVADILEKPVHIDDLLATVRRHCAQE